ncbi:MAG TPA: GntR family transcriptional regulator [Candidatus Saccharimonadales bacterium]|nr:GntR family transcriptional regulator [Candidatus Saccharimonadales bacterium]
MASKTLAQTAYEELRRRILILELVPNERLKEEEWAANLHVSRTAVREALTRLLGEGLLRPGERGGFFVTQMTEKDIHEVRELREVLEVTAFTMACERATADEMAAIEQTCVDFGDLVRKGYHSGACECDLRFHNLLVAASGNAHLVRAYQRANIPLFHMKLGRSLMFLDDYLETEQEHHKILQALKNREASEGVRLLKLHFRRGEELAVDHRPRGPKPETNHQPRAAQGAVLAS